MDSNTAGLSTVLTQGEIALNPLDHIERHVDRMAWEPTFVLGARPHPPEFGQVQFGIGEFLPHCTDGG